MSSHSQGSHGRAEHIVLTAQQSREPDILSKKNICFNFNQVELQLNFVFQMQKLRRFLNSRQL